MASKNAIVVIDPNSDLTHPKFGEFFSRFVVLANRLHKHFGEISIGVTGSGRGISVGFQWSGRFLAVLTQDYSNPEKVIANYRLGPDKIVAWEGLWLFVLRPALLETIEHGMNDLTRLQQTGYKLLDLQLPK